MVELEYHLWRKGYEALPGLTRSREDSDVIPARMLGRPALVVRGERAARLFYDESVVARRGAVPAPLARLLFGKGAVHGLDGDAHRARKAVFLGLLTDEAVEQVADRVSAELAQQTSYWPLSAEVDVFGELVEAYGAAVLDWSGARLAGAERGRRARQLARIVDGFGAAPGSYPQAWWSRLRANRWAAKQVRAARARRQSPPVGSPLHVFALGEGRHLDPATAGVELLNVLRPTVAVAWLGTFAVRALHEHPSWRPRVLTDERACEAFAQEVRRLAPFVPALAAKARADVEWQGARLPRGGRLVLDVPGTNRDPRSWTSPETFDPQRFLDHRPGAFEFVPQGGGHPEHGHRCPGEGMAVRLLQRTLTAVAALDYEPLPGSAVDLRRIPPRRDVLRIAVRGRLRQPEDPA